MRHAAERHLSNIRDGEKRGIYWRPEEGYRAPAVQRAAQEAKRLSNREPVKSYMQLCAINDGNAYALKVKSRGAVRQLIPLPRRKVKPRLTETFELVFDYDRPAGGCVTLTTDDVFHFGTPLTNGAND